MIVGTPITTEIRPSEYQGAFEITPGSSVQTLPTEGMVMQSDITVLSVSDAAPDWSAIIAGTETEVIDRQGLVSSFGSYVFTGAKDSLVRISLPAVSSLPYAAFCDFTALEDVCFPAVSSLSYAFRSCAALKTISFPALQSLCAAFSYCTALETIYLPSATYVASGFSGCTSLKSISLPNATTIGWAFNGCTALETLDLPAAMDIRRMETYP